MMLKGRYSGRTRVPRYYINDCYINMSETRHQELGSKQCSILNLSTKLLVEFCCSVYMNELDLEIIETGELCHNDFWERIGILPITE